MFSPGRSLGEPLGLDSSPFNLCSYQLPSGIPSRDYRVHTQFMLAKCQSFDCFCYFFVFLFTFFSFVFLLLSTPHIQVSPQRYKHCLRKKRPPQQSDSEERGLFRSPAIVRITFTLSTNRECSSDLFLVQMPYCLPFSEWPLEGDLLLKMNSCNNPSPNVLLLPQWV